MFLQATNISFGYTTERKILNNISFFMEKGETLGIVGASGSGKSTLLRVIASLLPNHNKQFFFGELTIDSSSPASYLACGQLAFMFQEPNLVPNLSVFQNINYPLKIKKIENPKKVHHLIEMVGLTGYEDYLPKNLSGGMKTRVSMARAFITNPSLLLLDEPFSSLDIAWRNVLYNELSLLKKEFNTTVLLISHDIAECIKLSDKIICMGTQGEVLLKVDDVKQEGLFELLEGVIINEHKLRN